MTAYSDGGQLAFADDPYGKDAGAAASMVALQ
jgi:murein L,D-transpeptidase YcbB/YkuD